MEWTRGRDAATTLAGDCPTKARDRDRQSELEERERLITFFQILCEWSAAGDSTEPASIPHAIVERDAQ